MTFNVVSDNSSSITLLGRGSAFGLFRAGSVWTSPGRIPEATIHKYGAGSGSDRVMVELRIELQVRNYFCPRFVRSLPLPAPYLCGVRKSGNA